MELEYESPEYISLRQAVQWLAHGIVPAKSYEESIYDIPRGYVDKLFYLADETMKHAEFVIYDKEFLFGEFKYEKASENREKLAKLQIYNLAKKRCYDKATDKNNSDIIFLEWYYSYDVSMNNGTEYPDIVTKNQKMFVPLEPLDRFLYAEKLIGNNDVWNENEIVQVSGIPFREDESTQEDGEEEKNSFKYYIKWDELKKIKPMSGKVYPKSMEYLLNDMDKKEQNKKVGAPSKDAEIETVLYALLKTNILSKEKFKEVFGNQNAFLSMFSKEQVGELSDSIFTGKDRLPKIFIKTKAFIDKYDEKNHTIIKKK